MYKSLAMLALFGMIAACAAPRAAPQAVAESPKPAASSSSEQGTRVCEEFEEESTGTRLGTKKTCKDVPAKEKSPQTT